jgi:hypothetical protein
MSCDAACTLLNARLINCMDTLMLEVTGQFYERTPDGRKMSWPVLVFHYYGSQCLSDCSGKENVQVVKLFFPVLDGRNEMHASLVRAL